MSLTYQFKTPNPKQEEFFCATNRHIGYGGARGGGKSWGLRTKFVLLAFNYPKLKLLLLRRTFPELRENHVLPLMEQLYGLAKHKSRISINTKGKNMTSLDWKRLHTLQQYKSNSCKHVTGTQEQISSLECTIRQILGVLDINGLSDFSWKENIKARKKQKTIVLFLQRWMITQY